MLLQSGLQARRSGLSRIQNKQQPPCIRVSVRVTHEDESRGREAEGGGAAGPKGAVRESVRIAWWRTEPGQRRRMNSFPDITEAWSAAAALAAARPRPAKANRHRSGKRPARASLPAAASWKKKKKKEKRLQGTQRTQVDVAREDG